ncbi:PilZ domain-containing protein [Rhodoplanes azumiensis]|uniref:PilZ domain-containing protein n=1 Tax=Rhodoplanes azumiensis TaxID=1897628 RepID=A0ABW5AD15_9BRAD
MYGIDGTWQRACLVLDVSKSGAQIAVDGALEGLQLEEFFLALSTLGHAHRRCRLKWLNGGLLGVMFVTTVTKPKRRAAPGPNTPPRAVSS